MGRMLSPSATAAPGAWAMGMCLRRSYLRLAWRVRRIPDRNEWWRDPEGERSGYPSNDSSHTIGLSHQFSDPVMIRPEIGFYHSYDVPAFDLGKSKNLLMYGFDFTARL